MSYTLVAGEEFWEWSLTTTDSFETILSDGYLNADQAILEVNEIVHCIILKGWETEYRPVYIRESALGVVVVLDLRRVYEEHGLALNRADLDSSGEDIDKIWIAIGGINIPIVSGTFTAYFKLPNDTVATYESNFSDNYDRHYAVLDGTTPTLITDGFIGVASGDIDVLDYDSHSLTMWTGVLDGVGGITWTQRDEDADLSDGNGGVVLQANDTIPPTEVTDITYTSITSTAADLSFTAASDSGSGIKQHDLYNDDTGIIEQSDISSPVSLTNLIPGTTYNYKIQATDNATPANVSLTEDPASFTTLALSGGVITLAEPTAVTEGNNQTWTATRSGGTTGAASVDFATPGYAQDTAINGTNYTDTSSTFNWADGVGGTDTITVTTSNESSIENNIYQGELVPGTESGASLGVDIAQFGQINGAGGTSDLYPETLVSGSTYRAVINAVNYSLKSTDGTTAFVLDSANADGAISDVMAQPFADAEGTGITGNLTYMRFKVDVHASADGDAHYVWARTKSASSTRNASYVGTGGVDSMTPSTPFVKVDIGVGYEWDEAKSPAETQASVALSAGENTIEIYHKEPFHYISQILVVNQAKATYTPVDDVIAESLPDAAGATDNLANPTTIVPPGDDTSPVSYSSVVPASAAPAISLTTKVRITYPGSALYMNGDGVVLTYNPGSGDIIITLKSITVDLATNTAIITPSKSLPVNQAIKVTIGTGSAHGGTTVVNGIRETLTNENYSFTTLNTSGLLFDFNFDSEVVGTVIDSATVLKSIFDNANGLAPTVSSATKGNWSIASDPASNPTRGNVLKIDFLEGTYGNGKTIDDPDASLASAGQFNWDLNSREQELYFAYDIYIPTTQIDHLENKLPGFRGTGGTPDPANPEGWGDVAMYCYSIWTGNRGPLTASGYSTRGSSNRQKDYWTLSDPGDELTGEQYFWGKGFWITVEQRVKNNTTYDPGNAVIDTWLNDPRAVVNGGTAGLHQKVFTETGRQFHLTPATPLASGWNVLWFGFYIGGTGTEYLIKADTSLYLTNFKLSTSRIYG